MPYRIDVSPGAEETKGDGDDADDEGVGPDGKSIEKAGGHAASYEFSLDPDTKAAEKKLRRVVAKQVG